MSTGLRALPAPRLILTIQVRLEGVPPYEATRVQMIPGMLVSQWQKPGGIVAVRVNPADHADVAVDFDTPPPTVTAG
jgi:hypothetical protein